MMFVAHIKGSPYIGFCWSFGWDATDPLARPTKIEAKIARIQIILSYPSIFHERKLEWVIKEHRRLFTEYPEYFV